jgi:hypothetical protein
MTAPEAVAPVCGAAVIDDGAGIVLRVYAADNTMVAVKLDPIAALDLAGQLIAAVRRRQ